MRTSVLKIALVLFLILSTLGFATPFCIEVLQTVNQKKYGAYCCETNIRHAVDELKSAGEDISDVSVLILYIPNSSVFGPNARNGWKEW